MPVTKCLCGLTKTAILGSWILILATDVVKCSLQMVGMGNGLVPVTFDLSIVTQ